MATVAGRITQHPAENKITVDLQHCISTVAPYTDTNLDVLRDRFTPLAISYGQMLSQRIRRLPGVVDITVNPYGLSVTIGALYPMRNMARAIKLTVETVMAFGTPWTVSRDADNENWHFRFGKQLCTNSHTRINLRKKGDDELLGLAGVTPFGRQATLTLRHYLVRPEKLREYYLVMESVTKLLHSPTDWAQLDGGLEKLVTLLVGNRDFTIDWD